MGVFPAAEGAVGGRGVFVEGGRSEALDEEAGGDALAEVGGDALAATDAWTGAAEGADGVSPAPPERGRDDDDEAATDAAAVETAKRCDRRTYPSPTPPAPTTKTAVPKPSANHERDGVLVPVFPERSQGRSVGSERSCFAWVEGAAGGVARISCPGFLDRRRMRSAESAASRGAKGRSLDARSATLWMRASTDFARH